MNNSTTITNLTNSPPTSPCVMSIDFGTTESIVMATLHSLIGILSIFGNFLILVAIYCTPTLHLVSNYFLASLAVSDLVVGVLLSPMWVARAVLHVWQVNHPLTIATSWLTVFTTIATTLNLCAVSFDRYLSVIRMFDYQTLATEKRTKIVIAAIWIISCLVASSRFFIHDIFTLSEITSFSSLAAIVLTFLVTLYCYGHILSAALLQSGKIAAQERALRDQQTQAIRNRKAAWTVGIVIGLFVVLYTPQLLVSLMKVTTPSPCKQLQMMKVWIWCLIIAYFNSCCNPWVYAARSNEFRIALQRILTFCRLQLMRTTDVSTTNMQQRGGYTSQIVLPDRISTRVDQASN